MGNDKEFKVVDKRHSAPDAKNEDKKSGKGDGFVMEDSPKNAPPEPAKIDLSTFCLSLATGAMINMGLAPDPMSNKTEKNIPLAQQNIDILAMLQEKTKGNLTPEEDTLINNLLTEVRLRFVEASK